ncbi:MAG TPA: DUF6306 domain-containing protein [Ktedonobacterales bacterium]|jgi:hypothetical protein
MDDLIRALNKLLEAERAGVEALVDLTRMSADVLEREMLQRIGGEEAWACASLRGQIEALGGMPSRQIGPLLTQLRARDHFAARLRLFAQQQQAVLENLKTLLEDQQLPEEVRELLAELYRIHAPNIAWCEQRAAAFGMREGQQENTSLSHAAERRPSPEGREVPYRSRNKRQTDFKSRRGEASRAEDSRRTRLTHSEDDEANQPL